jgi:hypothetical protein
MSVFWGRTPRSTLGSRLTRFGSIWLLPPVLPAHATYPDEHGRSRPHASQEAVIRVNHLGLSGDGVDAGGLRRRLGQPDSYNAQTRRVRDAFERQYLARQEART